MRATAMDRSTCAIPNRREPDPSFRTRGPRVFPGGRALFPRKRTWSSRPWPRATWARSELATPVPSSGVAARGTQARQAQWVSG